MKNPSSSTLDPAKSPRLEAYLAVGLQASALAASAVEAGIVQVDIGPTGANIAGVNAGLAPGGGRQQVFPSSDQYWLGVFNNYTNGYVSLLGLAMGPNSGVAFTGGYASPRNFAFDEVIDSTASFTSGFYQPVFRLTLPSGTSVSPDFGPNSYIGFRTNFNRYGWMEVTWSQASAQFQILSAAYEDQAGVAIRAGQVPEPGAGSLAALVLGGAAVARWRAVRGARCRSGEPVDPRQPDRGGRSGPR